LTQRAYSRRKCYHRAAVRKLLAMATLSFLVACSTGLRAINDTDGTDDDTQPPVDSGEPIDTSVHDGNNTPPVADAGPDQTAEVGDVVVLDASNSSDEDGDALSFEWMFASRPSTSSSFLIDNDRVDPEFYADAEGTYVARVVVSDGQATDQDEVTITVDNPNGAPIADAGYDQTVSVGDTVQLNGGGSSDPDGDALNFRWRIQTSPSSSSAALDDPTSPLPRFLADRAGAYVIELVVDDGEYSSSPAIVRVQAQSSNDDDCLSCAAEAQRQMAYRWTAGAFASGPALVLLPIFALLYHRRREDSS